MKNTVRFLLALSLVAVWLGACGKNPQLHLQLNLIH